MMLTFKKKRQDANLSFSSYSILEHLALLTHGFSTYRSD